jgi:hypothetical protein
MKTVTSAVSVLVFTAAVALAGAAVTGAFAQHTARPSVVQPPRAGGKFVFREHTQLRRFDRPVLRPVGNPPPLRNGFVWRWHRHYGWVSLPAATAPAIVLLPEDYTLPARVEVYEPAAQTLTFTCPHCGLPLTVEVK